MSTADPSPVASAHPPAPPAGEILDVTVELDAGDETRETMFGIRCTWPAGGLATILDPEGLTGDLTPLGQRLAQLVYEELEAHRLSHWGESPTLIRITVANPADTARPWEPAYHRAAPADIAEAAANLDRRPVPTQGRHATERAAQAAMAGAAGSMRRNVLHRFAVAGDTGLTDDELAVALDAIPNRIATRRKELQDDGLVAPTGRYRNTRSNVPAVVHYLTEKGAQVWRLVG